MSNEDILDFIATFNYATLYTWVGGDDIPPRFREYKKLGFGEQQWRISLLSLSEEERATLEWRIDDFCNRHSWTPPEKKDAA